MDLEKYEEAIQSGNAPQDAPEEGFLCFKKYVSPVVLQHNIDELDEKINDM
jgi:hypothetical protein